MRRSKPMLRPHDVGADSFFAHQRQRPLWSSTTTNRSPPAGHAAVRRRAGSAHSQSDRPSQRWHESQRHMAAAYVPQKSHECRSFGHGTLVRGSDGRDCGGKGNSTRWSRQSMSENAHARKSSARVISFWCSRREKMSAADGDVLFVRRFTKATLAEFKKLNGFEKVSPWAKSSAVSDKAVLAMPDVRASDAFDLMFGLACVIKRTYVNDKTNEWRRLLLSALHVREGTAVTFDDADMIQRFRDDEGAQTAFKGLADMLIRKRMQDLAGKPPNAALRSSHSSARGGGPGIKRPATGVTSTRANNKLFKKPHQVIGTSRTRTFS
jgi:hypothetical protein